jgi:hypothetical protein
VTQKFITKADLKAQPAGSNIDLSAKQMVENYKK